VGVSSQVGLSIARMLANLGYRVICADPDKTKVTALAASLGPSHAAFQLDPLCKESLAIAGIKLPMLAPLGLDVVINAIGGNNRKSFELHASSDIKQIVESNFIVATRLLKLCLPCMKHRGTHDKRQFVQLSGFVNARVAFPYYSIDVAVRSATRTLFESVQRELSLEGHKNIRLKIFCPAIAKSVSPRPFLFLKKKPYISTAQSHEMALALLGFIAGKSYMGAMGNGVMSLVDFISPKLASYLWFGKAGQEMESAFNQEFTSK